MDALGIQRPKEQQAIEIGVYADNLDAVDVWHHCRRDMLGGLAGGYLGASAAEIRDVCQTPGIDVTYDRDLLWRVRTLDDAYGAELSRIASEKTGSANKTGKRR